MSGHLLAEAARCCGYHGYHGGYGDYLAFRWLWERFRWWSIAISGGGMFAIGFIRAMLGGGDD